VAAARAAEARGDHVDVAHARYQYGANYLGDPATLRDRIVSKTIIPHQVEWQPGPPGQEICWLQCPYCYGGSAELVPDRLPLGRALDVLADIARGPTAYGHGPGPQKIIFAGYATDPLFSKDLTALVTTAVACRAVVGFNTKALAVPEKLLAVLPLAAPESYVTVSVDAGSNEVYNAVHAAKTDAPLYDRVMENLKRLKATGIEVAATYLVSRLNCVAGDTDDMEKFISDACDAGVDVIRFAFAQMPRGGSEMPTVPTWDECRFFADRVRFVKEVWDLCGVPILLADADADHDLFRKPRTLPCVARWIYPTVGYDGWLYPCSQTGAPNFRGLALGNLAERGFWEMYYEYDEARLAEWMHHEHSEMIRTGCRCDRKEHLVNIQAGPILKRYGIITCPDTEST
jgi:MoaA/NifB/PqqE/SkfB family radical SAM enzyme